ncbi:hypothetical protein MY04_2035 [Flammeovirga sp. MY04]|uniref:hypothetical protein n=1 Tax=Flammeovirga sp. MY04 TaxID=1191459 RepID=UPI0008060DF5|nr:hypothetical protein [Flammeovirga sp. MY04]ANQ49409.1 hypothetical protein MY04_2035 [Flammeovirga sp. MY04]
MKLLFKLLFLFLLSSCSILEGLKEDDIQNYNTFESNLTNLIHTQNIWSYNIEHVYTNDNLTESNYIEKYHLIEELDIQFTHDFDDDGRIYRSKVQESNQPIIYYYYSYNSIDQIESIQIKNINDKLIEVVNITYNEDGLINEKVEDVSNTMYYYFYDENKNINKITTVGPDRQYEETLYEYNVYDRHINEIHYNNGDEEHFSYALHSISYLYIHHFYKSNGEATIKEYIIPAGYSLDIRIDIKHYVKDHGYVIFEHEGYIEKEENKYQLINKSFNIYYGTAYENIRYQITDRYLDDGSISKREIYVLEDNLGFTTYLKPTEYFDDQKIKSADVIYDGRFSLDQTLGSVTYVQDQNGEIIGHSFYNIEGKLVNNPVFEATEVEALISHYGY